ncbi:MAG: NAD(P)-dependent alcohol dehydrogenase [Segniliparus sp.]|uniref:NAD(P)-dependent alcohol dehydrogenase n=1 Tax=Segniliparus sp. TaxID=2804064 RepID=UPI003F3469EF
MRGPSAHLEEIIVTLSVPAYAAFSPTEPLRPTVVERREPGPKDIVIDIAWAGICHSDIHTVRNQWGPASFPVVPGHEIAGVVTQVGSEVEKFKVGDHAGVGCMVGSCGECPNCKAGDEQYCSGSGMIGTYNAVGKDGLPTYGGYSDLIVVDEGFALKVPDNLPLDQVAPLLCAGITTYSPLRHWNAGPGTRVGVVGLGGLGHMAVKLADAMGAEVTVLSQSLRKQEDGLKLGADHYYATSDKATFKQLARSFDLILNTVSDGVDIAGLLELLDIDGTLVQLGLPEHPLNIGPSPLIMGRRRWAGSLIGGIAETQEMLDFCGEKGIGSEVERIESGQINEAYDRVVKSDVRYRFVIDGNTFKA